MLGHGLLGPPWPTWGQSPLGSCFRSRQRTPLSRASTQGCLGTREALNTSAATLQRTVPLAAAQAASSPSHSQAGQTRDPVRRPTRPAGHSRSDSWHRGPRLPVSYPDPRHPIPEKCSMCRGEQAGWAAPQTWLGKGLGCSRPAQGALASRHCSVLTPGQETSRAHPGPLAFRIL